jgi:hypothetical protein
MLRKTGAFSPENVRRFLGSSVLTEDGSLHGVWFNAGAKLRQPSLGLIWLPVLNMRFGGRGVNRKNRPGC